MPRIARNKVTFTVDGIEFLAEFKHQHAVESTDPYDLVECPVYEEFPVGGGLLGSQEMEKEIVRYEVDARILKPIIEQVPMKVNGVVRTIERKLRHVTTCVLYVSAGDATGNWKQVGEGASRCSVKDKYDWRYGVKESFRAAIENAGIEQEGPMLYAYYEELRHRPVVATATAAPLVVPVITIH